MSRNPKPTAEELRFVYEMIAKGYDDNAILHEYCKEYESGQLKFPFRTDKRFIRERRMEFEAASDVFKRDLKREVYRDPKEEHFARMADIAASLLRNGLDTVARDSQGGLSMSKGMGVIMIYDELTEALEGNFKSACFEFSDYDVNASFVRHLEAEVPDIRTQGLQNYLEKHPYEMIETLRLLCRRKTFKGNCPICKDWA